MHVKLYDGLILVT